jgi:sugar (pentulose or hexulose) kinase
MAGDCILSIDVGTQSLRALVIDLNGEMLAKARVPIRPCASEQPGWAEEDPEYFWQCLGEACEKLWTMEGVRKQSLAGVVLTTQRATVVNVDQDGRPLRPAILWLDRRRAEGLGGLRGPWGLALSAMGLGRTVAYLMAEAEANWLRTRQPEIWAKTHKYLLLSGFLNYKLTGRFADSVGCQVGYIPFDYKHLRWCSRWDWKWRAVAMDPSVLPELVPPGGELGRITPEASGHTGIPAGLPVLAAAADKACEVLGSGSLAPETACLSYGTTATINVPSARYVEAVPFLPPYPAAIPGAYNLEIEIYRGYWMVSWFKQEFGDFERRLAPERGVEPEALFDDLVRAVPPGSMGLLLQPYWSPGLMVPGPEARGAILGFSEVHTRAHIYRAILEGLAYALRDGKERIERRSGVPIRELRICGGGSQSDEAMQLTASIFGLPASRPRYYEAAALGAAIDGAVGLGLYSDYASAVRTMARLGRTFDPDPHARALYDDLYENVYRKMYARLRPLYESIQRAMEMRNGPRQDKSSKQPVAEVEIRRETSLRG